MEMNKTKNGKEIVDIETFYHRQMKRMAETMHENREQQQLNI